MAYIFIRKCCIIYLPELVLKVSFKFYHFVSDYLLKCGQTGQATNFIIFDVILLKKAYLLSAANIYTGCSMLAIASVL
jgi:hypothetical protein